MPNSKFEAIIYHIELIANNIIEISKVDLKIVNCVHPEDFHCITGNLNIKPQK